MNGLNRHQNAPVSGVLRSLRKTWLGVRCRIEFKVVYAAVAAGRDPASLQGISLEAVIRTRLSLFSPLTGFR
jgi:hypothetical protein